MSAEERIKQLEREREKRLAELKELNRQRREQANGAEWSERERVLRAEKFMTW